MATIASLIVRVAADVSELKTNMEKAQGFIAKTAKVLASAWVVDKMFDAVRAATQFAGSMNDLADRTGIGVQALQELRYAAALNGTSIESLVGVISKLQQNLVGGDTTVVGALGMLRLELDDLRQLRPEDQFSAIAAKLRDIQDPAARARLAVDLMGRGAIEIMPLVVANIDAVREEARRLGVVLDTETIQALDAAGDSLDRLKLIGEATMARVVVPLTPLIEDLAGTLARLPQAIDGVVLGFDATVWAGAKVIQVVARMGEAGLNVKKLLDPLSNMTGVLDRGIEDMRRLGEAAKGWEQAAVNVDRSQRAVTASTRETTDALPPLILNYGAAAEAAAKAAAEMDKLREREKQLFFEIRMWGVRQLREMTQAVEQELRKQMDLMGQAALALFDLENASKQRLQSLFDPAPVSAMEQEIAQLDATFKAHFDHLDKQAERAGPAWRALADSARENLTVEYNRLFTDIVSRGGQFNEEMASTLESGGAALGAAAQSAITPVVNNFIGGFHKIEAGAQRTMTVLERLLNMDALDAAYRGAGLFVQEPGFFSRAQHRSDIARGGMHVRPFADGGIVTRPTIGLLGEAGPEAVIPLTRAGSALPGLTLTVHVAPGYEGPGAAARAGRQAADAILQQLRAKGYRI